MCYNSHHVDEIYSPFVGWLWRSSVLFVILRPVILLKVQVSQSWLEPPQPTEAAVLHTSCFLFHLGPPLQGLQKDVDNARHRLLTVQGSLGEVSEENAGLKRELEGERIKTTTASRRLADTVERQDNALAKIRLDSTQLREQRDRRGLPDRCTFLRQVAY